MRKKKAVNFTIDPEIIKESRKKCKKSGRKVSSVMEILLDRFNKDIIVL